jgi:hypothetical protein
MSNGKQNSGVTIGFTGLLTIVFITLKLCKVINWSWVRVLSPVWVSASLVILFVCLYVVLRLASENRK